MTVHVYSSGFLYCSVCAPLDMDLSAIVREVNRDNPTGISSPWMLSKDPTFRNGQPQGCVCEQSPFRRHWLLEC